MTDKSCSINHNDLVLPKDFNVARLVQDFKLERYSEYKDSGVEWLGEIPVVWGVTRIASQFIERNTKVSDIDFPPLSVTKHGIVHQLVNVAKSNDSDNRKLVQIGDFVINSRSDRKGSSGISLLNGSVSLINIVITPKNLYTNFCHYLLKSYSFIEEFYKNGHGIVADLWTTRYEDMKSIQISIPPITEQQCIAKFLDKKTAQIDQAVAQKEKMIELLKEYQQVIINNAITKGLDRNIELKPSGVDWLGDIPIGWEVTRLKYCCQVNPSMININLNNDDLIEFVPMSNVDEQIGEIKEYEYREWKEIKTGYTCFKNNDVIFAKITPCMENGNCVIVKGLSKNICYGSTEFIVFRTTRALINRFLYYILRNEKCRFIFEVNMHGSAGQKRISSTFIANFIIPSMPLQEQQRIADFLDNKTSQINESIKLQQQQIQKLKEYKVTLINSAVTGKIRV